MLYTASMETKILNYRIIIKQEKDGKKKVYLAECPTLGVYDWGNTIEASLKSIREGIECHIGSLMEDGQEVRVDYPEKEFVTETQVTVSINPSLISQ